MAPAAPRVAAAQGRAGARRGPRRAAREPARAVLRHVRARLAGAGRPGRLHHRQRVSRACASGRRRGARRAHPRLLRVLADALVPDHRRGRRGAQRHPVPHQPQGQARPHPGHQHREAVHRQAVRGREAGDQPGRPGRERAVVLPRLGGRGWRAPGDSAPGLRCACHRFRRSPRPPAVPAGQSDAGSAGRGLLRPRPGTGVHPGRVGRHDPPGPAVRVAGAARLDGVPRARRASASPGGSSAPVSFSCCSSCSPA